MGCERTFGVEINERQDEELERSGRANEQCLDRMSVMGSKPQKPKRKHNFGKFYVNFANICTKLQFLLFLKVFVVG